MRARRMKRWRNVEMTEVELEERRLPLVLNRLIKETSCTIDVGCHIGSFLSAIVRLAPDGTHIAIEPSPTKCRWLRRRFPDVNIIEGAASDQTGYASFEEDHARSGYSRLSNNGHGYQVRSLKLDDLPIAMADFIKIDVEGDELKVLRGADRLIERWRPRIIFECACELQDTNTDRRGIYEHLTDIGYEIFCFADFLYDRGPMGFDEFRKCGLYPFRAYNYIALPK